MTIMRTVLDRALRRQHRRFRQVISVLIATLVVISGYGFWRISVVMREKRSIDESIRQIESKLETVSITGTRRIG